MSGGTPGRVPELSASATRVFFVLRTRRSPIGRQGRRPSRAVGRDLWSWRDRVRISRQNVPGWHGGGCRPQSHRALRQDHRDRRPFRVWQDHDATHGQPNAGAHDWSDHMGWHSSSVQAQDDAAPPDGLRHSERRAVPAPYGAGEHRNRAFAPALAEGKDREAVAGVTDQCWFGAQAGTPLSGAAVRRAAAAGWRGSGFGG